GGRVGAGSQRPRRAAPPARVTAAPKPAAAPIAASPQWNPLSTRTTSESCFGVNRDWPPSAFASAVGIDAAKTTTAHARRAEKIEHIAEPCDEQGNRSGDRT